jgi:hypothetical protein
MAEGIRMKLALVFVALIGLVLIGLPFSVSGDSSLTGAVQSFMTYSFSTTGLLLGLLTIFMSRSMSDEFAQRQILLVMTKPVPRWEYVLGKWAGITLLNAVLLVASALTIYGMVHYIRATHPPIDDTYDVAALNNEVLVARHALRPQVPDFREQAKLEFDRNIEEGLYDNVPDFNPDEQLRQLAGKHEARWRIVGPYETRVFEFRNVLCDRSPENEIHVRYKTRVIDPPPDEIFRALWIAGDVSKGTPVYRIPVRHIVARYHTFRFPADAVAADNTLTIYFRNQSLFPDEPQFHNVLEFRKSEEVEALFVVGSFEGNFLRLVTLMQCKLAFLAAVALLMTTVFSFPVACLGSFTVYVFAAGQSFLAEALDWASNDYAAMFTSGKEFLVAAFSFMTTIIYWIVPNFAEFDAVESFVNGRNVSLVWVLNGLVWLVLVKSGLVLGLAMLLFHRREVAEVSV